MLSNDIDVYWNLLGGLLLNGEMIVVSFSTPTPEEAGEESLEFSNSPPEFAPHISALNEMICSRSNG